MGRRRAGLPATCSFNRKDCMFNFFHPRPVIDGRAVAVKVVQQKASTQQDTRTLVVASRQTAVATLAAKDAAAEK